MATIVEHEGESAIIFPDELLRVAGWQMGDEVDWHVRKGVLVLTKAKPKASRIAPA